jgi:DNA segregation ATPase FtsK/SpoIIIE-like protein
VFIIDEYASFVAILSSMDKKTKDKVRALLYEIVLQGRQLGFFIFLVTQQAHSNIIETAIRENIPLKIVLGNSEHQTYVTAFGSSVKIPNYNYSVGKGIFTEPTIAPEPKLVECPYFAFDILDSI